MPVSYQYPPPSPARPTSHVAIAALILGIAGILTSFCLYGFPAAAAILCGHIALRDTKTGHLGGRGIGVAGLILGYIGVLPAVILLIGGIVHRFAS